MPDRNPRAGVQRRQSDDPAAGLDVLPPASERRLLSRHRRFEKSSDWSMRLAMILLGTLVVLILISWGLDRRG